jgi:flagellar protein FlaH
METEVKLEEPGAPAETEGLPNVTSVSLAEPEAPEVDPLTVAPEPTVKAVDPASLAAAAPAPAAPAPEPGSEYDDPEDEDVAQLIIMGVMDVDKKLGGGIPLDSITLVEGDPESGKSVVVQQLAYNALKIGLKVVAFISESTPREFLDQMTSLGMQSTDYYLVGRLSLYRVNLRVEQEQAEQLMRKLLKYIEKADGPDVIIFDSMTALLFQFDARYVLSFLATCKELANMGRTILVSLHSYAINESLRLRAGSIVDAHLRLRIEELGKQVVRTLEVTKIRGAVKTINNTVSFTVEAGVGLKSVPISKTKA